MSIDWIPSGPTRKIRTKERGNRGIIPSEKVADGIIEYESCLERDLFIRCDQAPDVVKFQHQPITIKYQDKEGKNRVYTPDLYVELSSGHRFIFEVKYKAEVIEKAKIYEERWMSAQTWCEKRGMIFFLLTEEEIRTTRWYNVWFTLGSSKCFVDNNYISSLLGIISDKGHQYDEICFTFAELLGISINKSYATLFIMGWSLLTLSQPTRSQMKLLLEGVNCGIRFHLDPS